MSAEKSHRTPAQVFGARVREARERLGWSQVHLAERLHIDRTTLNKIEKGTRGDVRVNQLFAFALALDVAPVHLLVPLEDEGELEIVPGRVLAAPIARSWVRGLFPLALTEGAGLQFLRQMPDSELRRHVERALMGQLGIKDALARALMGERFSERVDDVMELIRTSEGAQPKEK